MNRAALAAELEQALYADALEFERRGDSDGCTTSLGLTYLVMLARFETNNEPQPCGGSDDVE